MIDSIPVDDLKVVAEIGQPDLSYEFDEYLVWADTQGRLYYAHDSGCSCPTPFEDYKTTADMQALTWHNWDQFNDEIAGWYGGNVGERNAFTQKVKGALNDPEAAGKAVVEYRKERAKQRRKDEFRRGVLSGLAECRKQIAEVVPAVKQAGAFNGSKQAEIVADLQTMPTTDILVLGVYLTRRAEDTLLQQQAEATA